MDEQSLHQLLHRGVVEVIVEEEFLRLLQRGKPLRLKMGFDPSRPDIHLGHVVGLRKLRQFQNLGHQVVLIVGDWTAQIGDPSGQSVTRPMLTPEEVKENAQTYLRQFFKVVDQERTRVVWQSDWFGAFGLADVIQLTSGFTVAQFLAREDFSKRYREGRPIAITEFLYPLLQAYDSIAVNADVEFGGTDQKFNLLVGRELQERMGQTPQQCVVMPILPGTDGAQKMSKSLGNYIAVEEPPEEMFGKVMSLPDHLILTYFTLLTDVPDAELEGMRRDMEERSVNPMNLKKRLGEEMVAQLHSRADAHRAQEHFQRVVQRGETPEDVEELRVSFREFRQRMFRNGVLREIQRPQAMPLPESEQPADRLALVWSAGEEAGELEFTILELLPLTGIVSSRSKLKRLVEQGAVEIMPTGSDRFHPYHEAWLRRLVVHNGDILRVGKRRFLKVVNADLTGA